MNNAPTMPTFTHETGSALAQRGVKPKRFWINSMGEYGHNWENDLQSVGGTINLVDAAHAEGVDWKPGTPFPSETMKRAERRALDAELVHPIEYVVYRAWSPLSEAGSDLWRFYAGVEYADNVPVRYSLDMVIEYVVPFGQQEEALRRLATTSNARMDLLHEDFDEPTKGQFAIEFDMKGMSVTQACHVQATWLILAEPYVANHGWELVSVL